MAKAMLIDSDHECLDGLLGWNYVAHFYVGVSMGSFGSAYLSAR